MPNAKVLKNTNFITVDGKNGSITISAATKPGTY
jgi:hypothetical protein